MAKEEIEEQVRQWQREFNAIDRDMIADLMQYNEFDWEEVTDSDDYDFEYGLPANDYMWSFSDWIDTYWLEEKNGIKVMSELGFKIFHSCEYGYFFGVDTTGTDLYEDYWLPLYEAILAAADD